MQVSGRGQQYDLFLSLSDGYLPHDCNRGPPELGRRVGRASSTISFPWCVCVCQGVLYTARRTACLSFDLLLIDRFPEVGMTCFCRPHPKQATEL